MKFELFEGDIFDVDADAISLPAGPDLNIDNKIFESTNDRFKTCYEEWIEKIQYILPLTGPAVFHIATGNTLSCKGLILVYPGSISDVPTRSELIGARQSFKDLMDRVLEEDYDSIAISLPSMNSPNLISEILHSVVNRVSKKASVWTVTLVSSSKDVLKTTRSLLGGDNRDLSSAEDRKNFLKMLKIASPDVLQSASKMAYKLASSKIAKKRPADEQCYFSKERKTSHEKHPREAYAAVSTTCDGTNSRISDLQKNSVNKTVSKLGVFNEMGVVLARGVGIFDEANAVLARKWSDKYICKKHLDELARKWEHKTYSHEKRLCSTGVEKTICGIPDHEQDVILGTPRAPLTYLTKTMAHNYLIKCQKLLPIGLHICAGHSNLEKLELEDVDAVKNDPTWKDEFEGNIPVSPEVASLFNQLVEEAGIRGATPTADFGSLLLDTKLRRVYALKKLNEIMMSIMAPGAENELRQMFIQSFSPRAQKGDPEHKLKKVLDEVAEQYEKSTNRRSKEIILSTVVDVVPYRELQEYIPDVSVRKYYNAKRRAKRLIELVETKYQKCRYEPVRIGHFIAFITSKFISIDIPYGERHVRKSDRSKMTIPNSLRLHRNAEIWRMFVAHMEQENLSHLMIKKSVAHAILKRCAATRRHAMTCVDYFVAEGLDAFEDLDDILDTLVKNALLDVDVHKEMKQALLRSKTYLRTDYKMHVKEESKVADHCMFHALSDPHNKQFKYKGDAHDHELKCPRCKEIHTTFKTIKETIDDVRKNLDDNHGMMREVNEMEIRWTQDVERIYEMKKHFLRSVYTDLHREKIIESLEEGEGLLTLDFAQKHLPMWKWESQTKYFGKRGMSYHIAHVLVKRHGHTVQHSFVHVIYTSKQDNVSVVQMMDHVFGKLQEMGVSGVHVRADNAGAYHSLGTISSVPRLANKNKINVKSFSFSEAQNGKSSCDRVAAQVKRRVRDYVASRKTIANESQFFKAIAQSGLQGVSVYLARIIRGTEKQEKEAVSKLSPQMPNITQLGHFEFDKMNARAWKFSGIGDGVQFKNLSGFNQNIKIIKEGGMLATPDLRETEDELLKKNESPKSLWLAYLKKEKKEKEEEPDDGPTVDEEGEEIMLPATNATTGLFECKKCGASYIRYSNLVRHVETESHFKRPENKNLYDCALKMYKARLEGTIQEHKALDQVNDALADLGKDDGSYHLGEGWALRGPRKAARYTEKAKNFVEEKFKEGAKTGRKMDPAEVERLMKEFDKIKPWERMNAQQIRSYFSKLTRDGKLVAASKPSTSKKRDDEEPGFDDEDEEDLYDEDERDIDCFGRDAADVIDDMIYEKFDELALSSFRRTSELTLRGINIDPAEADEEKYEIIPCTYRIMNEGLKYLIIGLFEFINSTFTEFRFLQNSEKWLLIRNYGNMFNVIDAEFRAERRFGKEPPGIFGSYSTFLSPDEAFTNQFLSDCPDSTNKAAAGSALHSVYHDVVPKIKSAIHAVAPTEDEYLALMGLSFWSIETFDASDKLLTLATRHRTKIINELSAQYRTTIGEEKGASRVGSLLCMLQELRRIEMTTQSHFEMLRLLGTFDDNTLVYRLQLAMMHSDAEW